MRSVWLFWRAQSGPSTVGLLALLWLVLALVGNSVIASPGHPEGALIQVWLPLAASVITARAAYDRLGLLARSGRPNVLIARACWLLIVSGCLVLLAATGTPPEGSLLFAISPALPVCVVAATSIALSRHLGFNAVAIITFVEGMSLYFLATPALRGGRSGVALLWNGALGWGTPIGVGLLFVAIAWRVWQN